jgi:hypothetical protein
VKLKSPALEKRVREVARDEMRLDKSLWKDYTRHRKSWLRRKLEAGNKLLFVLPLFWVLIFAGVREHGRETILVAIALYATATTLFRGLNFRLNVVGGYDRALFLHFPVSDDDFLKYEWKKFVRSWLGAFCVFLLAYWIVALRSDLVPENLGQVLLAAVLQTLCGASLSMWVPTFFPRLKIVSSAIPIYFLTFICLWLPAPAIEFLWSSVLLVPAGWISHVFASNRDAASRTESLLIAPAAAFCLTLPLAFHIARKALSAELDRQTRDGSDKLEQMFVGAETPDQADTEPISSQAPLQASYEHISERPSWETGGWIEKLVARSLNAQERIVAEFMLAQNVGDWSKRWSTAALISAVGVIVTALAPLPPWILFLPMVAGGLWGAPLFGGIWPGFNGAPTFGGVIPTYAVFPIGYGEISRVMFKANTIRILVWAPLLIAYATVLAKRLGNGPHYGLVDGILGVALALVLQPLMITAHFSAGTNDTRQINLHTLAFFGLAIFLLIPTIASVVGLFVADSVLIKSVAAVGVLVCTLLAWIAYMRLFNRGRIDLLSRAR